MRRRSKISQVFESIMKAAAVINGISALIMSMALDSISDIPLIIFSINIIFICIYITFFKGWDFNG